ncbi:MAG: chemotaxis protein CheA [Deltaproteobacteria bacterium]|nr:chemotaxis protein CheA [Deltaproteobacteria bacterium]
MPETESKILENINQLAILTMMVEPDDMITLGSILEKLECIEKEESEGNLKSVGVVSGALKNLVEKIILRDLPDISGGLDLLREGIRIMQRNASQPAPSQPEKDEETFWGKIGSLVEVKVSPPLRQNKTVESIPEPAANLTQDMEIYSDFITEALEHLNTIELNIINLEQNPDDKECINNIFRPFHTIKGVSGFLNLQDINKFAHAVESLLDNARNGRLQIHRGIIDFILEAVDLLKNMILDLKSQVESGKLKPSDFQLETYLERIKILQAGGFLDQAPPQPKLPDEPDQTVNLPLGEILSAKGIISQEDVSEALRKQADGKSNLKIGEILIKENKAKPKQVIEALREQKNIPAQSTEATIKVDTSKLDNLVDMIGELVIAQSLVQQNPVFSTLHDQKLTSDFAHLKRITTDLQKISMNLRMVPIRQTFQKMIRLVRDLAKKSEKQVDLIMTGEETEIDRNMVDALYEPLVHMIRNSIDHGIETPQKRREAGKLETGRVFLRAYQKGGNVVIEIEDDGQGLNRPKIIKKARERNLISEETQLTDYQIDNLIFEPGFSTAEKVTDVSGRGVGMDVVKKTIEKLKGKVEIFSVEGKGCRFLIRVPLTLAIMDGIIVRIGEEKYIIPTVFVKDTLRPRPEDISTVQNKGTMIKARKTLMPLIRLYELLNVRPKNKEPWEALTVVVENDGCLKGFMVDDLIGKQEVVIKNLGEMLKKTKGVAGATIMGDGRVGLILDIHGIFELNRNS